MSDTLTDIENEVSTKVRGIKLPSKSTLLIVIGSLFVSLIVVLGVALYQHQRNVQAAQLAASRADAVAADRARSNELQGLKAQVAALQADKLAACNNYKALATGKYTRSLVTVPTAVHCQ